MDSFVRLFQMAKSLSQQMLAADVGWISRLLSLKRTRRMIRLSVYTREEKQNEPSDWHWPLRRQTSAASLVGRSFGYLDQSSRRESSALRLTFSDHKDRQRTWSCFDVLLPLGAVADIRFRLFKSKCSHEFCTHHCHLVYLLSFPFFTLNTSVKGTIWKFFRCACFQRWLRPDMWQVVSSFSQNTENAL